MSKSRVIIVACENYREEDVDRAIAKGIDLLGGFDLIFGKSDRLLLKPNLLVKAEPQKAVTTHPEIFKSVGKLLLSQGYKNLFYGDSPGNPIGGVARVAAGCGISQPAEELGIKAADFSAGQEICFEEGKTEQHFIISNGILECDGIINLCKMKTHQLERITGATKNLFGAVYGVNKGAFHAKHTDANSFGRMIADLNNLLKKKTKGILHIMDGITAMEGNGPQSGTPIDMKLILMSLDPIALDSVFCHLIYLKPELVPTNVFGQEYGVGTMRLEEIEIITEKGSITQAQVVERYGNKGYDVNRDAEKKTELRMLRGIQPFLEKKPYIVEDKCVKCGICVDSCPLEKKALMLKEGNYPRYDYALCIKCYCCQEMCPQRAIEAKTPLLAKLVDRNWRI